VHLHDIHGMSLKHAYQSGVAQFRALRASHEQATKSAQLEAQHYGAEFNALGYIGAGVLAENAYLKKWTAAQAAEGASAASRASQRLLNPAWQKEEVWTGGKQYLRPPKEEEESDLEKSDVEPSYSFATAKQ
jgi:hypothetical protein